ncbi:hypothetical protein [Phenylobacterium sp.]|uniref:hypothetical protein n=1 Tax=Phenylobacterium sp. TaxID=1871053 RepID=UPI003D2B06B7
MLRKLLNTLSRHALKKPEPNRERPRGPVRPAEWYFEADGHFKLTLTSHWTEHASDEAEQWLFHSEFHQASITLSMMLVDLPLDKMRGTAEVMANARREAEQDIRAARNVRFSDYWTQKEDDRHVWHVTYEAADDASISMFTCWVTQRKVLSFYIDVQTRDRNYARRQFEALHAGFEFAVP